jgi:hypothetical protein
MKWQCKETKVEERIESKSEYEERKKKRPAS